MATLSHIPSIYAASDYNICNISIKNFAFFILFELHVHCICVGWAWSKAERGLRLNLKFGPCWTFGPRRAFSGPRRAVSPGYHLCHFEPAYANVESEDWNDNSSLSKLDSSIGHRDRGLPSNYPMMERSSQSTGVLTTVRINRPNLHATSGDRIWWESIDIYHAISRQLQQITTTR